MLNVTQSVENLFITIHIFLLVSVLGLVHTLCVLFLRAITRVRVLLLRPRACTVLLLVTRIRTILLLVTRIRTVLLLAARIRTILLLVGRIRTVLPSVARIRTILLLVTRIRTVLLLDVGIRTVLFLVARIGSVPLLVARVRALPTSVTRISIHFEVGEERGVGGWLVQVVVVRRAGSRLFVGVDDQHRRRLSLRHRSIHLCLLLPEAALPQSAKHQNCPTDQHPQHEIAPRSVFREHLRNRVRRFGRPLRRVSLGGGGGGGTFGFSLVLPVPPAEEGSLRGVRRRLLFQLLVEPLVVGQLWRFPLLEELHRELFQRRGGEETLFAELVVFVAGRGALGAVGEAVAGEGVGDAHHGVPPDPHARVLTRFFAHLTLSHCCQHELSSSSKGRFLRRVPHDPEVGSEQVHIRQSVVRARVTLPHRHPRVLRQKYAHHARRVLGTGCVGYHPLGFHELHVDHVRFGRPNAQFAHAAGFQGRQRDCHC
jgi:hypothetical protein